MLSRHNAPNDFTATEFTPNQLVALNLQRARRLRGLTQVEAGERLLPYLGQAWSQARFSGAEVSAFGGRPREFTAEEIVSFALAFDLPVTWFFLPPEPTAERDDVRVRVGEADLSLGAMLETIFPRSGHVEERATTLLHRLGPDDRTKLQEEIGQHTIFTAAAQMKALLADIDRYISSLTQLTELLEAVKERSYDDLGASLKRIHDVLVPTDEVQTAELSETEGEDELH